MVAGSPMTMGSLTMKSAIRPRRQSAAQLLYVSSSMPAQGWQRCRQLAAGWRCGRSCRPTQAGKCLQWTSLPQMPTALISILTYTVQGMQVSNMLQKRLEQSQMTRKRVPAPL